MKTFISPNNVTGKVIEKLVTGDNFVIVVFTDETYTAIHASHGYDSDIDLEPADESPFELGYYGIQAGILTEGELRAHSEKQRRQWEANRESQERQQYEQLKQKFGDK